MKHKRIWSWLVVALVIIGLLAGCAPQPTPAPATQPPAAPTATPAPKPTDTPKPAKTHFVVATDASFPPMEFVDENKNLVGFDIDLMEAIAKAMGFTVEWKNTAWDGIFAGLESGDYDAIMSSVTITDERKQKYDFSDPYINAGQAVVVRADETAIQSYKDLSGKVVGAQIGTTGAFAVEKIEGAKLKEYDTIDLALMDLVNKNIDAVVVDTPVAADYALASETFKGKLKIVGEPFTEEYYGLCVRKGETELLKLFNEGLKKVKASGEYDKIYKKWIAGEGTAPAGAGAAAQPRCQEPPALGGGGGRVHRQILSEPAQRFVHQYPRDEQLRHHEPRRHREVRPGHLQEPGRHRPVHLQGMDPQRQDHGGGQPGLLGRGA